MLRCRIAAQMVNKLKHWYVDCKGCARKITLQIYIGDGFTATHSDEILKCPACP